MAEFTFAVFFVCKIAERPKPVKALKRMKGIASVSRCPSAI